MHKKSFLGFYEKMGNKVYSKRNGKTFVRKAPGNYITIPTEKQETFRALFIKAQQFTSAVLLDPL